MNLHNKAQNGVFVTKSYNISYGKISSPIIHARHMPAYTTVEYARWPEKDTYTFVVISSLRPARFALNLES